MENPGIFIAVEGIDGAGKTTQVERLSSALTNIGEVVVRSKEPTDGPHGQRLRDSAHNGRLEPAEELETFLADRRDHVRNVIRPALDQGKVVIVDRYFYSTIAYQGPRTGHTPCELYYEMGEFPTPDVTYLIDVSPDIGLHRISENRGEIPNEFERSEALTQTRALFLDLLECAPEIRVVNGLPDIDTVYHDIVHDLVAIMQSKRCLKPWGCDMLMCSYKDTGECTWPTERVKILSQ